MNFNDNDQSIGNQNKNTNYSFNQFSNSKNSSTNNTPLNLSSGKNKTVYYPNNQCLTNQNFIQDDKGFICSNKPFYNNQRLFYKNKFTDPNVGEQAYNTDEFREIDREDIITKNNVNQLINERESEDYKNQLSIHDRITRINIDSRHRTISPVNIYDQEIITLNSALTLTADSNVLIVTQPGHSFRREDKISMQNVISTKLTLKNPLVIRKGDVFVKINQPHTFFENYDKYDTTFITLSNIRGNTRNYEFINNQIPVNLLNKTHQIFFTRDATEDVDPNFFFIQLPIVPLDDYDDVTDSPSANIIQSNIINLNGVALNLLNADYPLNIDRRQGFHIITNTTTNTYQITLRTQAVESGTGLGGSNIIIRKILGSKDGFPEPNNYTIPLKRTFNNVTNIELVSSEFPNSTTHIIKFPEAQRNDRLYWENAEDGSNLYFIEIDPGNYTHESLAVEIENKFKLVQRVNLITDDEDEINRPIENVEFHRADVEIDKSTSIISIKLFKEDILDRNIDLEENDTNANKPFLRINHKNHFLQISDKIIISNALGTDGIPANIINTEHDVHTVINRDNYLVLLPAVNRDVGILETQGGVAVSIKSPLHFRMFFDRDDTLGEILGFLNVGEKNSTTPVTTEVRNNIPYERDIPEDSVGNISEGTTETFVQNGVVDLNKDPYFLIQCSVCENSLSTGQITSILAKILADGEQNQILYNTFVTLERKFEKPISVLNELTFTILNPNGEPVNFLNENHSFTIEIIEKISNPTIVSSITGLI
jgi:hypothetical protein